jgi:hypothetical protein
MARPSRAGAQTPLSAAATQAGTGAKRSSDSARSDGAGAQERRSPQTVARGSVGGGWMRRTRKPGTECPTFLMAVPSSCGCALKILAQCATPAVSLVSSSGSCKVRSARACAPVRACNTHDRTATRARTHRSLLRDHSEHKLLRQPRDGAVGPRPARRRVSSVRRGLHGGSTQFGAACASALCAGAAAHFISCSSTCRSTDSANEIAASSSR